MFSKTKKFKKSSLLGGIVVAHAGYFMSLPALAEAEPGKPKVEISGLIEGEFGVVIDKPKTGDSTRSSDATLATVEIGIDAKLSDQVSGHVLLLHEEDDTPLEVDEGTITISGVEGLSFTVGQMYVPFGVFETNMVSDPLTLELGETRESAMMVSYKAGSLNAALYVFNGDPKKVDATVGEDNVEQKGFSVAYENDNFNVGLDYITSIADSDTLQGQEIAVSILDGNGDPLADYTYPTTRTLKKYIAGVAIHAIYNADNFNIIVERVSAMDKFAATDYADLFGDPLTAKEIQPTATNIEVGYNFGDQKISLAIQGTKDAAIFDLPEKRNLITYSKDIFEHVGLGIEYAKSTRYSEADDGDGGSETTLTAQVAIEF